LRARAREEEEVGRAEEEGVEERTKRKVVRMTGRVGRTRMSFGVVWVEG
jgi:hypothetical protein